MSWQNLIYLVPYAVALAISSSVGIYAWRRRAVRGATAFAVMALAMALRTLAHVLEFISPGLEAKIFWDNVHILGEVISLIATVAFVLDYTEYNLPHPKRTLGLLSIVPVLFLLLFFTNRFHKLLRPNILFFPGEPFQALLFDITPPVIVFALYAYGLFLSSLVLLFVKFMRSKPLYRAQVATIIVGLLTPAIGMALPVMGINLGVHRDISHFAFAIGILIIAWGLFRYRLFDIAPVARDRVIESMSDPVVVVDAQNRVVDLNPAAQANLDQPVTEIIGQPVGQVYADWPDLVARYHDVEEETGGEVVVSEGGERRHFDLRLSPLHDRRGRLTGRVLVVRDITSGRQAEEALRESEEKYRRLVESTTDWVWSVDAEGHHTFSNRAVKHLLGYEVDEVVGTLAFSLMHPEDREPLREMFQKSVERKTGWTDIAVRWLHKDDSVRFFESTAQPLLDAEGHLMGFTGIDRDITERKQAEEELKRHREQLEKLVEERTAELTASNELLRREIAERKQAEEMLSSAEAEKVTILDSLVEHVIHYNRELEILWPNQAACESAGMTREELTGRHCYEIWAQRDDPCLDCPVLKAMDTGQPHKIEKTTPDGRSWFIGGNPVRDDKGNVVGGVETTLEITERKRAEEALRGSEEKYRHLFEYANDSIFIVEPATQRILDVNENAARRLGYTREELLQMELKDLYAPDDSIDIEATLRELEKTGSVVFERTHRRKDGTQMPVEISSRIIKYGDQRVIQSFVRDITERKQAEEALSQRQRELESLLETGANLLSTLKLDDLLSLIAQRASSLLDADECAIFLLEADGSTLRPILVVGKYADEMMARSLQVGRGLTGYAVAHNQPILVNDSHADPRSRYALRPPPDTVEHLMATPLSYHGRITGAMGVTRLAKPPFVDENLKLLVGLARQAAIAIENAQLYEETRSHSRYLETLQQVNATLRSTLPLSQVLDTIAQGAGEALHCAGSLIVLPDAAGERLVMGAVWGSRFLDAAVKLTGRQVAAFNLPLAVEENPIAQAYLTGELQAWSHGPERIVIGVEPSIKSRLAPVIARAMGAISAACVPLPVGKEVVGVLVVFSPREQVSEEERAMLLGLADQAGLAIQNARLYQELEDYSEFLERAVRERTAELQKEKEQAEAILKGAADAILITDAEGTVVSVNPALETQTGFRADDIIGQQFRLLADPAEGQQNYQAAADAARVGSQWRGEMVLKRKDNTTYDGDISMAPLRESEGSDPWGFVFTIRDISAQKEVERLKDEFVSNVSHELRSPITSLKLRQHLIETHTHPKKLEHHLSVIRRETARLERTIDDLLYLSRLDQRQVEPDLTLVDLNTLAGQYVADRAPLAEEKGLTLTFASEPNLPPVRADEGLLGQVVSILLTNAIGYTPAGGQVTVSTRSCYLDGKRWVGFDVSDTGPGIPLAEQPRLFERFFRGKVGQASGVSGTGLGLAIAREIVERHKGRLEVESEGIPGKGAKFTVWLPVDEQAAGKTSPHASPTRR
jgi:PAS domain S-box-containing protein